MFLVVTQASGNGAKNVTQEAKAPPAVELATGEPRTDHLH